MIFLQRELTRQSGDHFPEKRSFDRQSSAKDRFSSSCLIEQRSWIDHGWRWTVSSDVFVSPGEKDQQNELIDPKRSRRELPMINSIELKQSILSVELFAIASSNVVRRGSSPTTTHSR
jgi:hypothetical protein